MASKRRKPAKRKPKPVVTDSRELLPKVDLKPKGKAE